MAEPTAFSTACAQDRAYVAAFVPSLSAGSAGQTPAHLRCVGWGFEAGYYLRHPATRQARTRALEPLSRQQADSIRGCLADSKQGAA